MGNLKNENQHFSLDRDRTLSKKYCVNTICMVQEKHSVQKKVTQRNQDSFTLYDDHILLMKKNISKEDTLPAETAMNVCSISSSRTFRIFQIATVLIASSSYFAEGIKLQSDHIAKAKIINESLSTTKCNPGNLNMTQSCHVEGSDLEDMLIDRCEFKDKCPSGYTPRCVDIDEGMVFICAPVNTKCSEGYRWKVIKDKKNHSKVHITVEICPDGYFQQASSDCFHACKSKHEDLRNIPEWYTVFTKGNNTHPTYVYCNYKKGYFNREDRFLLDYDGESEHNQYFCGNVNDNNPCVDGQMPLPNGTCVLPCKKNECREDHNSFICQQTCRHQTENKSSFTDVPDLDKDLDECDRETPLCQNGICKKSSNENICQCNAGFEYDLLTRKCLGSGVSTKTTKKDLEIWQLIMIVGFAVALVAFVTCAGCVIRCKHKKHQSQCPQVEDGNRQSEDPSTGTDETGTVTERNGSTVSAENALNKTKQNCSSIIFNNDAQNIKITQNYFQSGDKDSKSQEEDSKWSTGLEGSFTSQTGSAVSNKHYSGPSDTSHTMPMKGSAYDIPMNDEKEPLLADNENGVRLFKKDFDDSNSQAQVGCLYKLMQSCGAIVHRGNVKGSAFRAGPKYVITAFHVISDIVRDLTGRGVYDFRLLEEENVTINFNYSVINAHKRDIQLRYFYHNKTYDFAVFEIKNVDLHENIPEPLLLWKYDISNVNEKQIKLIGYGCATNPFQKREETGVIIDENDFSLRYREALASLNQNAQEYKNDISGNDKSSVDRGYLGIESEAFIKFDCCMEKGLSGGPIITNEGHSPKVIGIVNGGMPDIYYELSPEKKKNFNIKHLFEVGVKMQLIYEKIRTEKPELASELFNE